MALKARVTLVFVQRQFEFKARTGSSWRGDLFVFFFFFGGGGLMREVAGISMDWWVVQGRQDDRRRSVVIFCDFKKKIDFRYSRLNHKRSIFVQVWINPSIQMVGLRGGLVLWGWTLFHTRVIYLAISNGPGGTLSYLCG